MIVIRDANIDLESVAMRLVECWFYEQRLNPYGAYYLYHKPQNKNRYATVTIAYDPPDKDFVISIPERVSPAWDRNQAFNNIRAWLRKLPILPI